MLEAPKEMYDLVEDKFGGGWARFGLFAVYTGMVCTALIAVGTLVYFGTTKGVLPVFEAVKSRGWSLGSGSLIASAAITLVFVGAAVAFIGWRLRNLQRAIGEYVTWRLEPVQKRIERIENNVPLHSGVLDNFTKVHYRIDELEKRSVNPLPIGGATLKDRVVEALLSRGTTPVGKLGGPPEET